MAAKSNRCTDPVTHATTLTDLPCPPPPEEAASASAGRQARAVASVMALATREQAQLLVKYPDRAAHAQSELDDLHNVVVKIRDSTKRYMVLWAQRKLLDEECRFYDPKPRPADLQRKVDANDASFLASRDVFIGFQQDVATIVGRYERERSVMLRLWSELERAGRVA